MKNLLLLLIILIAYTGASAQPVLTAATTNPVVGDVYYGHHCDVTSVSKGAAGSGVTWNFATLASMFQDTTKYLSCTSTPYCDSFPGSTLATLEGGYYYYHITDVNKWALSGLYFIGLGSVHYTDPDNSFSYPMTYNSIKVDSYANYSLLFSDNTNGYDSSIGDAYGTLILPSGTHTNVLRVHKIYYDSNSSTLLKRRYETYLWLKPGFHMPLLAMIYDTAATGILHITEAAYYTQPTTGVEEGTAGTAQNVSVFPNPVKDVLHISADFSCHAAATISLIDMTGRTMDEINTNGSIDVNFQVSALPAGCYLLRINTSEKSITRMVTIVR